LQVACLVPAVLMGSVRAVGMTTWGVACAMDFSHADSVKRVESELANHPPGYRVVMSSAFLYDAAHHGELTFYHSDWMAVAHGDSRITDVQALTTLKPEKLILTQFDYYRRYQTVLERARSNPGLKDIQVINTARTRPPDSYKSLQQVVQHISWAPVIVNLSWRAGP
jgi:hypothetical protein